MIATLRATLALALLVSWYVVAFVIIASCLTFDVLVLWAESQPVGTFTPTTIFAAVASFTVVVAIVHGMLSVSRAGGPPPGSVRVPREDATALWGTVDELAGTLGVTPPSELYLTPEANAAVAERARLLGLLPGARTMYLGVPLLLGLGTAELRAVLCHELGHYARGHTRFGALTWRGSAALGETRRHLAQSAAKNRLLANYGGLLILFIAGYANVYDRLTLALRRRHEYAADTAAARVVGSAATASALRSVHALALAWEDFRHHLLEPSFHAGLRPDAPFSAFGMMLADPDYRDVLAERRDDPPDQPPSAWDSHPSLARRLTALADGTTDAAAPSDPVLEVSHELWRHLEVTAPHRGLARPKPLPWTQWLERVAELQAMAPVRALSNALRVHDDAESTPLETLLRVLDAGQGAELATLLPGTLVEAGVALIGHHLVAGRHAAWLVGWTGQVRLICGGTTPDELGELVRAAVEDQSEVSRLRLHLAELGVDPAAPLALDGEDHTGTVPFAARPQRTFYEGLRDNWGVLSLVGAILVVLLVIRLSAHPSPTVPGYRPVILPTSYPQYPPNPVRSPPAFSIPCGTSGPLCPPYYRPYVPPTFLPSLPPLHIPLRELRPRG